MMLNTTETICLIIPFIAACILLVGLLFGFHIFKRAGNAARNTINDWFQTR